MTTHQYPADAATSPVASKVKVDVSYGATFGSGDCVTQSPFAVWNPAPNASPPAVPSSPTVTVQVTC